MHNAKNIASLLANRADEVAKLLLPAGKKSGNEWVVGSLAGEPGGSMKLCLSGTKKGIFCDFSTGEAGDALDLWAKSRNITLTEAIKEAALWLGIAPLLAIQKTSSAFAKPSALDCQSINQGSVVWVYLANERKLLASSIEAYKILETNNSVVFPYWRDGELLQTKYLEISRPNGKKKIRVEPNCQPSLFGWQAIPLNARTVTLCEGEVDAISLYQYGYPALSLPFGGGRAGKHSWIEFDYEHLAVFDEIYLCLDQDSVGKSTTLELVDRLGRHRCKVVLLPKKDANECLQAGIAKTVIDDCFNDAATMDPQELKPASGFVKEVIESFYPSSNEPIGISPPWEKAKGRILFRPNELSLWTGICGHGKSQFLGQIMLASMDQGARVCVASLEIKPRHLLMRLTRQAAALENPTEAYIEAIHSWYHDKLWLFDLVGTAKANRLMEVFEYAYKRYGITVFVIDSFMKCGIAEDDFTAQKAFVERICDFKNEFNCHVHLVAHPRKGSNENECPNKLDIKGTGAISDLADNVFTVWRNKSKESEVQALTVSGMPISHDLLAKPDCLLSCDKNRNGEWEGKLNFWFNKPSFQYLENQNHKPRQYVAFSTQALHTNFNYTT